MRSINSLPFVKRTFLPSLKALFIIGRGFFRSSKSPGVKSSTNLTPLSVGFCRGSRIEGNISRAEDRGSRIEGEKNVFSRGLI